MTEAERSAIRRKWARWRDRLRDRRAADFAYRIVVAVVGLARAGAPESSPSRTRGRAGRWSSSAWAILATEFSWAQRVLHFAKARYDAAMDWFKRQHIAVQALGTALTVLIVLATLWLLGAIGWAAGLVGVDWPWLQSPIGLGS